MSIIRLKNHIYIIYIFTVYIIILSIRLSISQMDASLEFNFRKLPLSSSTCTVLFGRLHRPAIIAMSYRDSLCFIVCVVISLLTLDSAPVFPALCPLHPPELLSGPRHRHLLTAALLRGSLVTRGKQQVSKISLIELC